MTDAAALTSSMLVIVLRKMKAWRLFAGLILLSAMACAEDVRLSSGQILRNVTFNWADSAGVILTPNVFGGTATKYPWHWIHPEDAAKLRARGEAQEMARKREREMEESAINVRIRVIQVLQDGVLARIVGVWAPSLNAYRRADDEESTIFISGATSDRLVDGKELEGKLYRCGRYQYESVQGALRTVARYAVSSEKAAALNQE